MAQKQKPEMIPDAKKYSKILYFIKDKRMRDLADKTACMSNPNKNKLNRHYPYNAVSKHFPLARILKHDKAELVLPCGFKNSVTWGALKKCWKGYKRAKADGDEILMREYATRIQTLEGQLGIPTASFPNLSLLGDIFFLYDKDKERELRQQYMFDNIQCDRYGDIVNNMDVDELVGSGQAKLFDNKRDLEKYMQEESYKKLVESCKAWAMSGETQERVRIVQKKWDKRKQIHDEILQIKDELKAMGPKFRQKGHKRNEMRQRRQKLMHEKVLKESELKAVETITLVKVDDGWRFAKEILENSQRTKVQYDYEPTYYLTDLNGRRLGNYKEEREMGYDKDPYFYRLYLEDKAWELYNRQ